MRGEVNKWKKVDGHQLPPSSFAYVGDPEDTDSWKFPVHFPSDESKSINHIKSSLSRFDGTKGIPESERRTVWLILTGAAKAHGLPVEPKQFQSVEETQHNGQNNRHATTTKMELTAAELALKLDRDYGEVAAMIADADRRADAILKSLGVT